MEPGNALRYVYSTIPCSGADGNNNNKCWL
jgi:hypothetical protein